jgi:hypothetical protein
LPSRRSGICQGKGLPGHTGAGQSGLDRAWDAAERRLWLGGGFLPGWTVPLGSFKQGCGGELLALCFRKGSGGEHVGRENN